MRIGIVCYPTYGGSGVVATELGRHLAARGHEVHFISLERPFRLDDSSGRVYLHRIGLPDYPVLPSKPYGMAAAGSIADVVRTHKLDVVHVHYAVPHLAAALLAQTLLGRDRVPLVVTLHGTDVTVLGHDAALASVMRDGLEQVDRVTAVSRYLRRRTRELFGVSRAITVIPNFVDVWQFRPRLRKEKDRMPVVIHVSNFRPVKRIDRVIRVFARMVSRHPAKLLLVGDGPERAAAEALVERFGIREHVHFAGKVPNVAPALATGDLFLLPSAEESFGLAAVEAMACGLPVLASRVGGLPEVVVDGETGFLFDPDDEQGMAEAGEKLLFDAERRYEMGRAARDHVMAHFTADKLIPRYEELYQSLVEPDDVAIDSAASYPG